MTAEVTSSRNKSVWLRVVLAGPWAFFGSVLVMCALAVVFPPGAGRVDNLVIPLVLFPLIWAVSFFHSVLTTDLRHAMVLNLLIGLCSAGILLWNFLE